VPAAHEQVAAVEPVEEATVNLTPVAGPAIVEENLDEDTQRYIAQALTDVDLFSSYGLTQKATHLLENVLQRAPRHTPTLERLLDLHLGAGNDRRTAELSAQLEQIHRERNDHVNADRFGELRRRYSKVAGITESELPAAPAMVARTPVDAASPTGGASWSHEANPQVGAAVAAEPAGSAAATLPVNVEPPAFEIAPEPVAEVETPASAAAPIEFEIPLVDLDSVAREPKEVSAGAVVAERAQEPASGPEPALGELDLSDEWAAISNEAQEDQAPPAEAAELVASLEFDPIVEPEPEIVPALQTTASVEDETIAEIRRAANEAVAQIDSDAEIIDEEPDHATGVKAFEIDSNLAQTDLTEDVFAVQPAEAPPAQVEASPEPPLEAVPQHAAEAPFEIADEPAAAVLSAARLPESLLEFLNEPAPEIVEAPPAAGELEIELTPEPVHSPRNGEPMTTDEFISDLAAEFDELEAPPVETVQAAVPAHQPEETHSPLQEVFAETAVAPRASAGVVSPASTIPPPPVSTLRAPVIPDSSPTPDAIEHMNELAEVFQEFRSELGEMSDEDEDLETHYNLGIAYREMGLLDEAIGEFQKVAKAIQKGKPFRYEMNCSTMLGLSFMDKGEPMVASLWYKRALTTPDLEEESILALQYDLGLALESAGEANAALDSFRRVYAANIDYRDVADRIATLQKQ
jgi:hypothetical protein